MAKRRKLETPTAEDLGKIEAEFRGETPVAERKAPIARVAAEAAGMFQSGTPEMRRDEAQAAAFRVAEKQGRVIKEIDLDEIDASAIQRDRTVLSDEAMAELEHSIAAHGLRLPIEIYPLKEPRGRKQYGLLSGYRRLIAQRNLLARTDENRFATIKAVHRDPDQIGGAFVAMVEENEVRQDLSHYERGRIAVIASQQGAFASTEDAVAAMFAAGSKAKRSKIRSFALIFEALGDVLQFPESLKEKDGLKLAQALRAGTDGALRDALALGQVTTPAAEWELIAVTLDAQTAVTPDPKKGGRPTNGAQEKHQTKGSRISDTGVKVQASLQGSDYVFRLKGRDLSEATLERMMQAICDVLDNP